MKTKNNNLKKGIITFSIATQVCTIINAQDKITLINGKDLNGKVIEISNKEVKYKKENNLEGPNYILLKDSVFSINYQNGSKDVFGIQPNVSKSEMINNSSYNIAHENTTNPSVIDPEEFLPDMRKKFSGPRVGLTFITDGTISDYITNEGRQPIITQFGWQFEKRIFTIENGTSGIVEFIPLIGGVEQGLFLPSANLLIGLRGGGKQSFEFAMGPNLSISGIGMLFATGTNFKSGKVNFPVNIAVVPSIGSNKTNYDPITKTQTKQHVETGWRITLTVGFNSRKK